MCWPGSLNFRDVMLAYGKLSKDLMKHKDGGTNIGLEFSGLVSALAPLPCPLHKHTKCFCPKKIRHTVKRQGQAMMVMLAGP